MSFQRLSEGVEGSPGRRSPGGRTFHSRGPAAEKFLSPSLLCVRGTSSFRMSCVMVCVCLSVTTKRWTDRDAVWVLDSGGTIRLRLGSPQGKGQFLDFFPHWNALDRVRRSRRSTRGCRHAQGTGCTFKGALGLAQVYSWSTYSTLFTRGSSDAAWGCQYCSNFFLKQTQW